MNGTPTEFVPRRPLLLPFLLGDLLLLGLAVMIFRRASQPLAAWETISLFLCVATGAWLSVIPFWLEFRAATRANEATTLENSLAKIQNLEQVAAQISSATAQWQNVREDSSKTVSVAHELAEKMAIEARAFTDFLQKANDTEKSHLRLEVEKFRRAEGDSLQIIVRMLDHVFALHQAALRSGQASIVEQISSFQNACRDTARRIGLLPFAPAKGEPFDSTRHQLADENAKAEDGVVIGETLAAGYTFQGQLLLRALVKIQEPDVR